MYMIKSHAGGRVTRIAICRETGGYEVQFVHYDSLVQVYRALCDLDDIAPDDDIVRDESAAHRHFGIPSIPPLYQILQDEDGTSNLDPHLDPHRPTNTPMPITTSKPPGAATSSSAPEIARPSNSKTKASRSSAHAAVGNSPEEASNSKKGPKASRSRSSNAAVDTSPEDSISPVRTSRGVGYSECELGGNRHEVAKILDARPVWNDEVVQALLENGALPRLHSAKLGYLRETGNHQILCVFVQPNGRLVEQCSSSLGTLWIDYGHHKDVKKLWGERKKLLSNRNRNIR